MILLLFTPLMFLGFYLLAIIDLRFERGRERDFLKLLFSSMLPIILFAVTLWIANTPDQYIWASSISAVLTLGAYLNCGFDLIAFRKEESAQVRSNIALAIWFVSLAVYAFFFFKRILGL